MIALVTGYMIKNKAIIINFKRLANLKASFFMYMVCLKVKETQKTAKYNNKIIKIMSLKEVYREVNIQSYSTHCILPYQQ